MFKGVFERLLVCGMLLCGLVPATLSADVLEALRPEAQAYLQQLAVLEQRPEDGRLLVQAAELMVDATDCRTAVRLLERAARLGAMRQDADWLRFAQVAGCAGAWREASWLAWRVLQETRSGQRIAAWALLGESLEQISDWRRDWKAEALHAYRTVLAEVEVDWVRERAAKLQQAVDYQQALRVVEHFAERDQQAAALCLRFNHPLDPALRDSYRDFIRVTPDFDPVVQLQHDRLCLRGAAYGRDYQVKLLAGMTTGQHRLEASEQFRLTTGDRDAEIWFNASAYVLPDMRDPSVPLHSVNVPRVNLRLYRVDPRGMLTDPIQSRFGETLNERTLERIRDELGEQIWQQEFALSGAANQNATNHLQLPADQVAQPGLYLLAAADPRQPASDWQDQAVQWLVVTDIGLTSYQGRDGLLVQARSLHTAMPLAQVKMGLYGRNNQELAIAYSDQQGMARFDPGLLAGQGGRRAAHLLASAPASGFALLSLQDPGLDLSDRGVSGRQAPGPMDAFLYTERGVYRPGETLSWNALLRDAQGHAANHLPAVLKLFDASGNTFLQRALDAGPDGSYQGQLGLPASARTGSWRLALYLDPQADPVGESRFLVESIEPPRLEASLELDAPLRQGRPVDLRVRANYLFGAPVARRPVNLYLSLEADSQPFSDYPEFRFGPLEDADLPGQSLPAGETDGAGEWLARLSLEQLDLATVQRPVRARVRAEVVDLDGRSAVAEGTLPVRHLAHYPGIRPLFADDRAPAGEVEFMLASIDATGQPRTATLRWQLFAEKWDYQWFRQDGDWKYQRTLIETPVDAGELAVSGLDSLLPLRLERGDYRLQVAMPDQPQWTAYRFQAGDQVSALADAPGAVQLTLDQTSYRAGDVARLQVTAPFAGEATLVLANERVRQVRQFSLSPQGETLTIPVDSAWGGGLYALLSVYRPGSATAAARAVGVIWLDLDPAQRRLGLSMELPQTVRPRQRLQIPVRAAGASPGERLQLVLTAVDEGVLGLTDYASPDPVEHFFGKRRLGVVVRDLYGRLIAQPDQRARRLRNGAGDSGRRGAPLSHTRILSLFSGVLQADGEGVWRVPLELPDFNGRLRLMAVAWSQDKVGSLAQPLTVADELVVSAGRPRFLAAGDVAMLSLQLHNRAAPDGAYQVSVRAGGTLALAEDANETVTLAGGQQADLQVPFKAAGIGDGWLAVEVSGPQGFRYQQRLPLAVRGRFLPQIRRSYRQLAAGDRWRPDAGESAGLAAETLKVHTLLSHAPGLDVPGLWQQLQSYPYGCAEQVTSRAMPLLYQQQLAASWDLPPLADGPQRLQGAIESLLQKQRWDGAFGLWERDDAVQPWASVYALDFLVQARQLGLQVPDYYYQKGLQWLAEQAAQVDQRDPETLAAAAYAHLVLSRAGKAQPEDARYFADQRLAQLPTSLAAAQLAAALHLQGDAVRAVRAMSLALEFRPRQLGWRDYGSELRDLAAVAALLQEFPQLGEPAPLLAEAARLQQEERWLSSQEQAWLLLAAPRGTPVGGPIRVALDGVERSSDAASVELQQLFSQADGGELQNIGDRALWLTRSVQGVPTELPSMQQHQMTLQRSYFDLRGEPVDPARLTQGQLLTVVLEGELRSKQEHPLLLMDLLPAGLQAENPRLGKGLDSGRLPWLGQLTSARYRDLLDDRVVFALDMPAGEKPRPFRIAYLARVISQGDYYWPPAEIEDMYRPRYRARSAPTNIQVTHP